MTTDQRSRLIRIGAKAIVWCEATQYSRDLAVGQATAVIDALMHGSANGKATERALRVIVSEIEKTA